MLTRCANRLAIMAPKSTIHRRLLFKSKKKKIYNVVLLLRFFLKNKQTNKDVMCNRRCHLETSLSPHTTLAMVKVNHQFVCSICLSTRKRTKRMNDKEIAAKSFAALAADLERYTMWRSEGSKASNNWVMKTELNRNCDC